jgi:hypothetical protein
MALYRLNSRITPIGPRGHQVTVSATATDEQREEVRMDIVSTIGEAEARRDYLLVSLETSLRARGYEVVDEME